MKLLFINPASVDNLAEYDFELLSNLPNNVEVIYLCNSHSQYLDIFPKNINIKKIFKYNDFSNNMVRGLSYSCRLCTSDAADEL